MLGMTRSLPGLPIGKAKPSSAAPDMAAGDKVATQVFSHAYNLSKQLGCSDLEISRALLGSLIVIARQEGHDPGQLLDGMIDEMRKGGVI